MAPPNVIEQAQALLAQGRAQEAVRFIDALAAQGDPLAIFTLADWRLAGTPIPRDLAQARELFRIAGEAGLKTSGFFHTNLLAAGVGGPADWKGAMARLREEARHDRRRRRILSIVGKMNLAAGGAPASLPAPQRLSASPQVTLFPKLFSPAECGYLAEAAEAEFRPSVVISEATGRQMEDPVRTSKDRPSTG